MSTIRKIEINEHESPILVARVTRANGTPVAMTDIVTFSVRAFFTSGPTPSDVAYELTGLLPEEGYSDTLSQEYSNLMGDSGGHNFTYVLDHNEFDFQNGRYRVQVETQLTSYIKIDRWDVIVGEVL